MRIRSGPDGLHLFDRSTGLNILVDEVQTSSTNWARAPRQVSVALTNTCDLACPYCYAPKSRASLPFDQLCLWLHELDKQGCLGVGFGGGEPTLYSRFAEVCRYASRNTGLAVTFTTHAHRLTEKLLANLKGNVHFIRVSMDGVNGTYEALRGRPFSVLRQRLSIIRELAPFGINFVVNSRTVADLDAAIAVASEVGAVEFLLLPEQPVGGVGGIDDATSWALRQWVHQYRGGVRLSVTVAGADGLPTCDPLSQESGLAAYAHIDASGVLKESSFDQRGVPIRQDGVMQALNVLRQI